MFRSRITPMIAVTALVVAVLGSTPLGQAASRMVLPKNSVGASQLKKRSVGAMKLASNAVTSPKVKNGSLLAADFKAGQLPQGPKGDPGPRGEQGPYPDSLPSGKTVRGAYALTDFAFNAGNSESGTISYGFQLASAPTPHYIPVGGHATAECPGSGAAPEAKPGHLCVYEGYRANVLQLGFADPLNWYGGANRPYGTAIWLSSAAGGFFMISGSWAVTAA